MHEFENNFIMHEFEKIIKLCMNLKIDIFYNNTKYSSLKYIRI